LIVFGRTAAAKRLFLFLLFKHCLEGRWKPLINQNFVFFLYDIFGDGGIQQQIEDKSKQPVFIRPEQTQKILASKFRSIPLVFVCITHTLALNYYTYREWSVPSYFSLKN
jgi:hypothetical protein